MKNEINKAEVEAAENIVCDNCDEQLLFLLRDSRDNEFNVGLLTMLECIAFAVQNGNLPKLPVSWLKQIDDVYSTSFSLDEDILYFDSYMK